MAWTDSDTIGSGQDHSTLPAFINAHEGETPSGGALTGIFVGNSAGNEYSSDWQAGQTRTNRVNLTVGTFTDGTAGTASGSYSGQFVFAEASTSVVLHFDFTGIEFWGGRVVFQQDSGGEIRVAKCYFHSRATDILRATGASADFTLRVGCCLFQDQTTNNDGCVRLNSAITAEVYNCTFHNVHYAVAEHSGTATVINCASFTEAAGTDYNSITLGSVTTSASRDSTGTITGVVETAGVDWVNPATPDFHIEDASSKFYQAGTVITADWFDTDLCTTDLDGESWHATNPSLGCYEFPVVGGVTMPIMSHHYTKNIGSRG